MCQSLGKQDNMEYRFTDSTGKRYFYYPNLGNMPLARWQHIQMILTDIDAGMPGNDCKLFREALHEAYNKDDKARMGAILLEWKAREEGIIIPELVFQLIAACHIGEGQDAWIWNGTDEDSKAKQFELDSKTGLKDFFLRVSIIELIPYLNMSQDELQVSLTVGAAKCEAQRQTLNQYLLECAGKPKSEPITN